MQNEFLISQASLLESTFQGKRLSDHPLFTAKTPEEKERVLRGLRHLKETGWRKIRFTPENPLDSEVVKEDQRTAPLGNFIIWIRGPLVDFMKKAA